MTFQAQNLARRAAAAGRQVADYVENAVQDTNIVNSANIAVNSIADSVTGAVQDAVGAVVDPITEVTDRVAEIQSAVSNPASLLSSVLGFFGGALRPNELRDFASYSYVFTLGVLTNFETNFPDLTYRRRDPWITILKSGGGLGNSKATTIYENQGRLEYFIDNVNIDSLIGLNATTKQSNATNIEFKVTEPYSMDYFCSLFKLRLLKQDTKTILKHLFVLV